MRTILVSLLVLVSSYVWTPGAVAGGAAPAAKAASEAKAAAEAAPPPSEAPKPPEQLQADTPRTTPDGATFVAPGGWWIETRGTAVILTAEGDSRIAFVDAKGTDADAAVKAAWAVLRPDMKWALKLATDA